MGLRFYRRLRLFPGVTLNLSRRGISTSVGTRGLRVTLGHGKVRETVGLPGSGLSYTSVQTHHEAPRAAQSQAVPMHRHVVGVLVLTGLLAWLAWLVTHKGGLP